MLMTSLASLHRHQRISGDGQNTNAEFKFPSDTRFVLVLVLESTVEDEDDGTINRPV